MKVVDEFHLNPNLLYLNHAAVSPWPKRAAAAATAFANENLHWGATHADQWLEEEQGLRQLCTKLLQGGSTQDIALVKNTSEALSMVASGLQWQPGDEVIITDQEFPSNRIVWESLKDRGVKVITVPINTHRSPEDAIDNACTEKTRIISVSSVQYATGMRMDLASLGRIARQHQVLYCVDAIQSLGALSFDLSQIGADFVMADAHKWLLGPEGVALFYSHPDARKQLKLYEFGWHMVEAMGDYDQKTWKPTVCARKFECGSPNTLGIVTFKASLSLLLEAGLNKIEKAVLRKQQFLSRALDEQAHIEVLSPKDPQRRSGIVLFRFKNKTDIEHKQLVKEWAKTGLITAYRQHGIRLSAHFYTPQAVLERALDMMCQER